MDPFRKVVPGERLAIQAVAWNRVIDQIALAPAAAPSGGETGRLTNLRILCKNETSGTVDQWGILHITGIAPAITGVTGAAFEQFQTAPAVVGVTPTGATSGQFLVAVEPIKAGEFGLAAIDGVVQVKLDVTAESDGFATPKPGSTTEMKTGSSGAATILWKQPGTGAGKWGLVRIGAGAGGGLRLGRITGTWSKASVATVYERSGNGTDVYVTTGVSGATAPSTFTGVNRFTQITVTGGTPKYVICGLIGADWHLMAAECE